MVAVYEVYRSRVPEGYLPVALAEGGNLILLSVYDQDPGVYFWDHEEEIEDADGESLPSELPEPMAPSFDEFLGRLQAEPEVPEPQVSRVWVNPDYLAEIRKY